MSEPTIDPRLIDHAKTILEQADIPQESKAALWDHYHSTSHSSELARRIATFNAPDHIKHALVAAKHISDRDNQPLPEPEATVVRVLHTLHRIDAKILETAEAHPRILTALITAALKGKSQ